jgi:hypothetical protein
MLRLSLDAKARVNIGLFDRGGKNRITVETNDHDFNPKTTLTHIQQIKLKKSYFR